MMNPSRSRSEEARRRAHDAFAKVKQRDSEALEHRARLQEVASEKVARLRTLRMAKATADRQALEDAAAAKAESAKKLKAVDAERRARPASTRTTASS